MDTGSKTTASNIQLDELIADCLDKFFGRKLEILLTFSLQEALLKCNPYSLVIDGNENASEIVEELLNAHVRRHDETLFDETILGHAYGRLKTEPTKDRIYRDRSGQSFWTEITGDHDFYLKLIRLMKETPTKHRQEYTPVWDAAVNRFTAEFIEDFCFPDGSIDWEKLVRFVSEDKALKSAKKPK